MGNLVASTPNLNKKQLNDLHKAMAANNSGRIVGMINTWGPTNSQLSKEACQHLLYTLGREGETKKELQLEMFSKMGFAKGFNAVLKNFSVDANALEASGWACGVIALLAKPAQTSRKYENIIRELLDEELWVRLIAMTKEVTDDFVLENLTALKTSLMELDFASKDFVKTEKMLAEQALESAQ